MSEQGKSSGSDKHEGRLEALKTFVEQTKLLVSLASGFVLAPPAVLSLFRRLDGKVPASVPWQRFFWAEGLLVFSILAGYVVLGTVAGSQHDELYSVYRPATRVPSLIQLFLYVAGIIVFLTMMPAII